MQKRNLVNQFVEVMDPQLTIDNNTTTSDRFEHLENENNLKKSCKCGSHLHQKTNHSSCILNKKNIHLIPPDQLESILNKHTKQYNKYHSD